MNRPHYYFKVTDDGLVGSRLQAFMDSCAAAEEKAREWVKKQGASNYYESPDGMAGGVAAVEFDNTLAKKGWEHISAADGTVFFFPEQGSDLEREMFTLPVVSELNLISILSLVPARDSKGRILPFSFGDATPVVFRHHGYWYLDVPYCSADSSVMSIEEKEFYRRRMPAMNER